jgi:iduronate 2-sulfatase
LRIADGEAMKRLLTALVLAILSAVARADRPDIVMIAVDDLRPLLGCYGDTRIQTPNIDRLARQGVVFDRAYCQYAKCGTSRLSLMTGLRPDSIGVFSNNVRDVSRFRKRRPRALSLAHWLKRAGYHTQSFGKIYHDGWDNPDDWSVPSSPGREREMWEVVDETDPSKPTTIAERLSCPVLQSPDVPDQHLFAGRMTDAVIKTLHQTAGDQPRFLAVGYRRPHLPFVAPRRYYDLYQPDDSWLAANPQPADRSPVMAWFNSDGYVGSAKKVGLEMPTRPDRPQAIDWNGYEMRSYLGVPNHGAINKSKQLELLHAYAACVSYVDAQIGRLLDGLRASDRYDNTIVILWSDHGWHLGEQSAWGKMTNFEIATRVPLIIKTPGVSSARTSTLAELVDLYPTLCELAGVEPPEHLEGKSLCDVLRQPRAESDRIALSQYARFRETYMGRALRNGRYRFVAWMETETGRVVDRELYDHDTDPAETRNLAGLPGNDKVVEELEAQLRHEFGLSK